MSVDRSVFQKIANSQAAGGGNYLRDGEYLLTVSKFFAKKMFGGNTVVAELKVEQCRASGETNPDGTPTLPNPVGTTCSCAWKIDKHDAAAGNVKAFVLGILGYQESQLTESQYIDLLEKVTDDAKNPLRGMRVKCSTYRGQIRSGANAGKPITKPRWEKVAQTKEEVQARRAEMDKSEATATAMPATQPTAPVAPVAPAPVAPAAPAAAKSSLDDLPF